MDNKQLSTKATILQDLPLEVFRLSSRLSASGDRLVKSLDLTSSRGQVLGTIASLKEPQPVSWIARNLGVSRQNIQRIVNDLLQKGYVELKTNPHHTRAKLVAMTNTGWAAFEQALKLSTPWMNYIAENLSEEDIQTTLKVLRTALNETDNFFEEVCLK